MGVHGGERPNAHLGGPGTDALPRAHELPPDDATERQDALHYTNEFKAPGGLGAAASRVLVGGLPEREANLRCRS